MSDLVCIIGSKAICCHESLCSCRRASYAGCLRGLLYVVGHGAIRLRGDDTASRHLAERHGENHALDCEISNLAARLGVPQLR